MACVTPPDDPGPAAATDTGEVRRVAALGDLTAIFAPGVQVCLYRRPDSAARFVPPAPAPSDAGGRIGGPIGEGAGTRSLRTVLRLGPDPGAAVAALSLPGLPDDAAGRGDLAHLLELYGDLLGCPAVGLRVESLDRAMCPGWHVDRTGIRLLCTWRGPGTEWLNGRGIDRSALPGSAAGAPPSGRADPGDILLLKGSAWQGNAGGGAIHRSPPVPPGDAPRLLVALDALWDD